MPRIPDHTDRCTMSPDGHWRGCCAKHDIAYERQIGARWDADLKLMQCIFGVGFDDLKRSFNSGMECLVCCFVAMRTILYAPCVFIFVRLFGWKFWRDAQRTRGPLRSWKEKRHAQSACPPPPTSDD